MEQAQRKPNSVLFSLKELRDVERQRVQQEEQQQQKQEQQRLQAEQEARQKARQEAEQRQEQQRQRQEQQRQLEQRQQREDQLRLEEAERRARVEAEMQLQLERQRQELALQPGKGRLTGWIPAALAMLVMGMVAGYLGLQLRDESARATAAAAQLRQAHDRTARLQRTAQQNLVRLNKQEARHARRIAALKHALADARRPAAEPSGGAAPPVRTRRGKGRRVIKKHTKTHFKLCLDSDDPLSCLDRGKPGSR